MEVKMQINKLELKNIKYFASGSEETPCYNADIFINGKKAFHVTNNGCGGCDNQYVHEPFIIKDLMDLQDYLVKQSGDDFEPVDSWCHDRLYEYLDQKKIKRDMKTKFICINKNTNELFAYEKNTGISDSAFQDHMDKNHPSSTCLNFLPFDQAWKLFDGATS
tara:strand:- start:449 stop:937 length:489 start_codon:yes stop_codon:yes gene_type:complete